jgi:CIC family chloride channel protein
MADQSSGGDGPQKTLRDGELLRRVAHWARGVLARPALSSPTFLLVIALVVGVGAGFGAVGFRWLIDRATGLFFSVIGGWLAALGPYHVILLPAIGLLAIAPVVGKLAPETKGHGVPEVMEAVAIRRGQIRGRVVVLKALASAVCIGSGGSVGREGPIVQIGSAWGATLGRLLRLPDGRVRTLVSCGAAGGIAATFNAPLAAVFFAIEVISAELGPGAFGAVVAASFGASVIGRVAFGDFPAFDVPRYELASFGELPLFLLLGVVTCVVAQFFMRTLYAVEDFADAAPAPLWLKASLGGLIVGGLGWAAPQVFGVGYEAIADAAWGSLSTGGMFSTWAGDLSAWSLLHAEQWRLAAAGLVALVVLKTVATSTTLAAGGSGGVFAPSLFLGAATGAALGGVSHALGSGTHPGAFAIVGMAAAFAATAHAPMSAILIVFELTADYKLILPLMFACAVSALLSYMWRRNSIYTEKLTRRGVHVGLIRDIALLNAIRVDEAMVQDTINVPPSQPVREVAELFDETKHHGFPVVDEDGFLHGVVTLQDVRQALHDGRPNAPVSQVATHEVVVCFPHESLNDALRKLGLRDVGRLPVVDPEDHRRLLGLITRKNVISAYNRALMRQHERLEETEDTEFYE